MLIFCSNDRDNVGLKHGNDHKVFIEYSNDFKDNTIQINNAKY